MKLGMPYALNEIGGRSNQEDSIFPAKGEANESTRLFLVCDGMGGHENGEVASGLVCLTFGKLLADIDHEGFTVEMFLDALNEAYDALDREDPDPQSMRKMGTTLTFLHLNDHEVVVAHMGDSRVYHVRPSEQNAIIYQSSDHSLVNELVRAEIITPEEALTHPRRNVITRAMQPKLDPRHKADVRTFNDVQAGDYFFLCSDGVLESVTNDALVEILRRDVSDDEKIEAIKALCADSSRDNFSAYLVPVVEGLPYVEPEVVSAELVDELEDTHIVEDDLEVTAPFQPANHQYEYHEHKRSLRSYLSPMTVGIAVAAFAVVASITYLSISHMVGDKPNAQKVNAEASMENGVQRMAFEQQPEMDENTSKEDVIPSMEIDKQPVKCCCKCKCNCPKKAARQLLRSEGDSVQEIKTEVVEFASEHTTQDDTQSE